MNSRRREGLFEAKNLEIVLDGSPEVLSTIHSLLVGTIERLSLGLRPLPNERVLKGHFHFSANGMALAKVAFHSPKLLFGLGEGDFTSGKEEFTSKANAKCLEARLDEGFMLDGEMFSLGDQSVKIKITSGPEVQFWTL